MFFTTVQKGEGGGNCVRVSGNVATDAEVGVMQGYKPKNKGSPSKLEWTRNGVLPRVSKKNIDLPTL